VRRFDSVYTGDGRDVVPEEQERRQPAQQASFVSDVVVPLAQSLLTGVLFASVVAFLFAVTEFKGNVLAIWFGVFCLVSLVCWLVLLGQTRSLLWGVERLVRKDLDRDGDVGRPQDVRTVEVVVRQGNSLRVVPAGWLGLGDDALQRLAVGLSNGRSLAEGDLGQDRTLFPRGVNEYRSVRSKLVQAGLVELVNPNAPNLGYALTRSGQAVMERLSSGNTLTLTHIQRGLARIGPPRTGEGER